MSARPRPYLSYWTDGETRNRGMALVRFKQAYAEAGFTLGDDELPDHLAVVLEFAALGDRLTGDALLVEHRGAIGLLRDSLAKMDSAYAHVLDAVLATLPEPTPEIKARMAQVAASGPPVEQIGLEPFPAPHRHRDRSPAMTESPDHHTDSAVGGAALRRDRGVRRGHHLALPLRQVRLDHPQQPALRAQAHAIASPLFHIGILAVVVGHVIGLVIPEQWTTWLPESAYHAMAVVLGIIAGVCTITGVVLLIYRRRTVGPVFSATTRNDKFMYVFLVAAICLGLITTFYGSGIFGPAYNYRDTVAVWFRSIFYLHRRSRTWRSHRCPTRSTPWPACCCSSSGRSPDWCTPSAHRSATSSGRTWSTATAATTTGSRPQRRGWEKVGTPTPPRSSVLRIPPQHGAWAYLAVPLIAGPGAGGPDLDRRAVRGDVGAGVSGLVLPGTGTGDPVAARVLEPAGQAGATAMPCRGSRSPPRRSGAGGAAPWLIAAGWCWRWPGWSGQVWPTPDGERGFGNDLLLIAQSLVALPLLWWLTEGSAPAPRCGGPQRSSAPTSVGSVIHVKSLIRESDDRRWHVANIGYHVVALAWGSTHPWLLPFGVALVRAVVLRPGMAAARIGAVEAVVSVLVVVATLLAVG